MIDISKIKAACGLISAGNSKGTGYLLDKGYVATCAHVVKSVRKGKTVTIDFQGVVYKAKVGPRDVKSDCALLLITKPPKNRTPLQLGGDCKWKAPWDGYGYPNAAKGAGIPIEGLVSDPDGMDDQKAPVLILKSPEVAAGMASPLHGFSGSPVLVDGTVVGHVKRFISDPQDPLRPAFGIVYASRSSCVLNLVNSRATQSRPRKTRAIKAPTSQSRPRKSSKPPSKPKNITPPKPHSEAARANTKRVVSMVKKWTKEGMPKSQASLLAAESLIQMAQPEQALHMLDQAGKGNRATQLKALALAKTRKKENIDKSIKILEKLQKAGNLDAETGGLLGGRYKQKWQETGNIGFLHKSVKAYQDTFTLTKDSYPGINAASGALQLNKKAESKKLAQQVLGILQNKKSKELDQWGLATRAEAQLLVGDLKKAKHWYAKAVALNPQAKESIDTMRLQAQRNLESMGLGRDALKGVFNK
jgi:tetratricopeptide (TPR) repeat protein